MYRAPLHPENHDFKSRDKVAPLGNTSMYEMSSVTKNLNNLHMRAITEENESRITSRLNTGKKLSYANMRKKSNGEIDFGDDSLFIKKMEEESGRKVSTHLRSTEKNIKLKKSALKSPQNDSELNFSTS